MMLSGLCKKLEQKVEKVKLFRHPGGENRGAGASRNLGIKKANFPFIAFLDADDWYLPHRFHKDKQVFSGKPDVDAVFSYSIQEEDFEKLGNCRSKKKRRLEFSPDSRKFYKQVVSKRFSFFDTNTVTLRTEFLREHKLFDSRLRLHQDSELWNRLLRRGKFCPGEVERPVAVVRRHDKNRITKRSIKSRLKMRAAFIDNVQVRNLYYFEKKQLVQNVLRDQSKLIKNNWKRRFFYHSKLLWANLHKERFLKNFSDRELNF